MNSSANASLTKLLAPASEKLKGGHGSMTLLQLNSTFGVLPINLSVINMGLINSSIGPFLSKNHFAIPQSCVYAISGESEITSDKR